MERSALKIHQRVFVSCSRAKGNFCGLLTFCSENFCEKLSWLWSMRNNASCRKTRESPRCFSSLIGQKKIRSRQFKRFRNWFGKSKCQGASLGLTVNFHHKHLIDPTNCPWVYEDDWSQKLRTNKIIAETTKRLWMKNLPTLRNDSPFTVKFSNSVSKTRAVLLFTIKIMEKFKPH